MLAVSRITASTLIAMAIIFEWVSRAVEFGIGIVQRQMFKSTTNGTEIDYNGFRSALVARYRCPEPDDEHGHTASQQQHHITYYHLNGWIPDELHCADDSCQALFERQLQRIGFISIFYFHIA